MGWASGSYVMDAIIQDLAEIVPDAEQRQHVYELLIEAFEGADWDTQQDCLGADPAFDAALHARRRRR